MTRARIALAALAALLIAGMLTGCTRVRLDDLDPPREDRDRIELDGAQDVEVTLGMGAGTLEIGSMRSAGLLMDADFIYRPDNWEPEVDYDVERGTGRLSVMQPDTRSLRLGEYRYEWDISLAEDVPMSLDIDLGAGEGTLELGALQLTDLSVDMGAGDVTIDLSGDWDDDLNADINAGVGALRLIVPGGVGVRVVGLKEGLGSYEADGFIVDGDAYVNEAYEDSDVTLDLRVHRGVGEVVVELAD